MTFLLHIIIMACLGMFVALGYNMVLGKGKILYFGIEAVSLVSAYTIWVLVVEHEVSLLLAIGTSAVATAIISLLIGWLSLRLDEDSFGVMSLALHLMALAIVLNWQSVTRGALGIPRIPRAPWPESIEQFAIVTVIAAALWIAFISMINRGNFGRQLSALSEHRWHAQSLGINRTKIHLVTFLIAGLGSLLGAVLFPPYIYLLNPIDFNYHALIFFAMVLIAGGPGSVRGCVLSLILLTFLKEGIRFIALPASLIGPVRLMLYGFILLVAVWFRRDSLFPPQRKI